MIEKGEASVGGWRGILEVKWRAFILVLVCCLLAGACFGENHMTAFCHEGLLAEGMNDQYMLFRPNGRKMKTVALTFDDGPKAGVTDWLLEELAARNIQATFFLIGSQAEIEENEVIIRRMYEDGHQIGCHTYSHVQLTLLSKEEQEKEIRQWYAAVSDVIGDFTYCIRPPYGSVNSRLCGYLEVPVILWSVDTKDWTGKSAKEIADYIVAEAVDGDIVLLHDIFEESVQGAVEALDILSQKGYRFVTVDELLRQRGIAEEGGKVYRKAVCSE